MNATTTNAMRTAIEAAPAGTCGLVVEPWAQGEVYGVAANWAQASAPVYFYGESGWESRQYQVADFRHSPREALECELAQALVASGDDEDEAGYLLSDAVEF